MKAIIATLFTFGTLAVGASEPLIVPVDVYEFVKSKGCEQPSDFFRSRPSVEEPPYAVHVAAWGKWEIAVWGVCANRANTLLLKFDDKTHALAKCPDRIDGLSYVGGLTFIEIDEPAEWYYFLDTKKQVGIKGRLKTKAISNVYDGTGDYLVCVDNRWAARNIH